MKNNEKAIINKELPVVYIVTRGEYSDYGIVAVFDNKKEAEDFIEERKTENDYYSDSWDVGEWDLVSRFPKTDCFTVTMDKDGNTIEIKKHKEKFNFHCSIFNHFEKEMNNIGFVMYCHVWAKDEKHAVKIVNEKRAQIIAANLWGKVKEFNESKIRIDNGI